MIKDNIKENDICGIVLRNKNLNFNITKNYCHLPPQKKMTFMQKIKYVVKFWRNN